MVFAKGISPKPVRVSDDIFVLIALPICLFLGALLLWILASLQVGSTEAGALYYERLLAERSFSPPAIVQRAVLAPRKAASDMPLSVPYYTSPDPTTSVPYTAGAPTLGASSAATPTSYNSSAMSSTVISFPVCAPGTSCSSLPTSSVLNGSSIAPTSSVWPTGSANASATATWSGNASMSMSVMVSTLTVVSTRTAPGSTVEFTTTMEESFTTTVVVTQSSTQATVPPGFLPVNAAPPRRSLVALWLPCLVCVTSLLSVVGL